MIARRLLIFGINYAPEPTGIALNTTGLAEGLADRGWAVAVIAGVPHYPSWRRGAAAPRETRNRVAIERYPHYVPPRQDALRRGLYELTWLLRALPALLPRRRPDVVLGVCPSVGGALLALAASRRYGAPLCLLFQDLVGRAAVQSGMPGGASVSGIVSWTERRVARAAAVVVVVADGFADYFVSAGVPRERIVLIRNPVRLREPSRSRDATRARLGWRSDDFVVLHTGSMGLKQDLDVVLDAAARIRNHGIRFVLQGDGNQRARLETNARERGLANVDFVPLAAEDEYANVLAAADLLLLNQKASVSNMSMPAKLGSYFAAGRPVLAAVASNDETAREIERAAAGIVIEPGNAELMAATVMGLRERGHDLDVMGTSARRFADVNLRADETIARFASQLEAIASSAR